MLQHQAFLILRVRNAVGQPLVAGFEWGSPSFLVERGSGHAHSRTPRVNLARRGAGCRRG